MKEIQAFLDGGSVSQEPVPRVLPTYRELQSEPERQQMRKTLYGWLDLVLKPEQPSKELDGYRDGSLIVCERYSNNIIKIDLRSNKADTVVHEMFLGSEGDFALNWDHDLVLDEDQVVNMVWASNKQLAEALLDLDPENDCFVFEAPQELNAMPMRVYAWSKSQLEAPETIPHMTNLSQAGENLLDFLWQEGIMKKT